MDKKNNYKKIYRQININGVIWLIICSIAVILGTLEYKKSAIFFLSIVVIYSQISHKKLKT